MEETLVEFFSAHKRIFLTLHLAGVAVGMGGATITDILFFNFLRDLKISRKEADVMRVLSNVIVAALAVLYISGIALFFSDAATYGNSAPFLAKAAILVILTVNGVLMHKFIAPHMVKFSFLRGKKPVTMFRLRALSFAMGAVSFVSWYSVFLIAMLKSYLPEGIRTWQILVIYGLILLCAVLSSQIMHRQLHKKSLA
jgi:hypothetical protein